MMIFSRNAAFDAGMRRPHRLPRPTISVGNLTTGGTGKTPFVIHLCKQLTEKGFRPAVLLRGYGQRPGSSDSDEATMLTETLGPSIPVEADANRVIAAQRVTQQHPEVNLFLLDDAFQHRQVHRDLDLVLIDATQPFGFGHVLPRGLLREPIRNLRRADAVVLTRTNAASPKQLADLDRLIAEITGHPPIAHTRHEWSGYTDPTGDTQPLDVLRQARVIGVCGIGNPASFERSLRDHTGELLAMHRFPDHHHYHRDQMTTLLKSAAERHADTVVTTHKDFVKWRPILDVAPSPLPIYYPSLRILLTKGEKDLDSLLQKTFPI